MSRINAGMFTADRLDWETPQSFFDLVDAEFGFTLDVAAAPHNAKCARYYTEDNDALGWPWMGDAVWCNPPYGRSIGRWVEKGYREAESGRAGVVVMLIPARTDTSYWHDYVMKATEVRFIRGRLVFGVGEAKANAPFPSALIVFTGQERGQVPVISSMGRGALTRRAAS